MQSMPKQVWVIAVTDNGSVVEAQVVRSRDEAVRVLTAYLRAHEDYDGPEQISGICDWLAEHNEQLGVDIFPASQTRL